MSQVESSSLPPRSNVADTVDEALYEVRKKIYPRAVTGKFANWRLIMVLFTQIIYYGLPWLTWNDRQAFLLDLGARKFYIFGLVLWPQDVIYLTVLLIIAALSLFLFTAIAGRLFCGYACPQTVYTEIFMWIERKVEGDRFARIRLDTDPLSFRKFRIKATKHVLWVALALWTGFTFVGYFTSIRELGADVIGLALGPWQVFWLLFYSFATWGNAGFMREQVCKYMCPYARFQSAMVDKDTYVVTFDALRGEPRGGRSKKIDHKAEGLGDCVDCGICVQVCPTGIDIRDGLQYMCIGCGACIDGCNQVMDKMDYPKGLIRYSSEFAMKHKLTPKQAVRRVLRPRVLVYLAIWIAIIAAFFAALALRTPVKVDVMRDRGALAREVDGGLIENVYRLHLTNASEQMLTASIAAAGLDGIALLDQGARPDVKVSLDAASDRTVLIKMRVSPDAAEPGSHKIILMVEARDGAGQVVADVEEKTTFILPR